MRRRVPQVLAAAGCLLAVVNEGRAEQVLAAGQPARLEIRRAGEQSLRVTLMPARVSAGFPATPVLAPRDYPDPQPSSTLLSGSALHAAGCAPLESSPERPSRYRPLGGLGLAGDTQSAWKTLEAQIAVGINHSLSLSP